MKLHARPLLSSLLCLRSLSSCTAQRQWAPSLAKSLSSTTSTSTNTNPALELPFPLWLSAQRNASWHGLLANIYKPGSLYPGVVIAAPDGPTGPEKDAGTYWYYWTRDAALVMQAVVKRFEEGERELEGLIRAYVAHAEKIQRVPNKSGGLWTGGLGEPKFNVDGTAFDGDWGRPQHDGPALRAITIMHFLKLIQKEDPSYAAHIRKEVVKPDIEHVARYWHAPGFDLWEEVHGLHFFTTMVQSRALRDAVDFFGRAGDAGAADYYRVQHQLLAVQIEAFWDMQEGGTFRSHLDLGGKPTGVDCSNLLAVLHGGGGTAPLYTASSAKILASLASLVQAMADLYPINKHLTGTAIGRYPSDVYNGSGMSIGNPWFLCTSAVAETLFRTATELEQVEVFQVNDINERFARMLDSRLRAGTVLEGKSLKQVLVRMRTWADTFLAVQQRFVTSEFGMSEQFGREDGRQMGARDLTWSYGGFLSAMDARG